MTQGTLFDLTSPDMPPASHRVDPETSREAERKHTASGQRRGNAEMVCRLVRRLPDSTAVELWEGCNELEQKALVEMQEIRRRLVDLESMGRVFKSGCRECRVKGSKQTTWSVKEDSHV